MQNELNHERKEVILVTGAAGFIASHLCDLIVKQYPNSRVIAVDSLTYAGSMDRIQQLLALPNFLFLEMDIRDRAQMALAFDTGPTIVIHAAAESHVDNSLTDSAPFIDTNVKGTQILLEQALKSGVNRFHYVSTDEIYGDRKETDPRFKETDVPNPRNPYAATKMAAEHLVRAAGYTRDLSWSMTRGANTYGPRQHKEKFIPATIWAILHHQPVKIYGDGLQEREWLYVEDHARAILDTAMALTTHNQTYNVGSGASFPNMEILHRIESELRKNGFEDEIAVEHVTDRPGHDRRYGMDPNKALNELDFAPKDLFPPTFRDTVKWYWQLFKEGKF